MVKDTSNPPLQTMRIHIDCLNPGTNLDFLCLNNQHGEHRPQQLNCCWQMCSWGSHGNLIPRTCNIGMHICLWMPLDQNLRQPPNVGRDSNPSECFTEEGGSISILSFNLFVEHFGLGLFGRNVLCEYKVPPRD